MDEDMFYEAEDYFYDYIISRPDLNESLEFQDCLHNQSCAIFIRELFAELERNITISTSHDKNFVLLFGAPIILLIGTLGNALSSITLWKFLSENAFYIYLFVLAFCDLSFLYIGLFERWLREVSDFTLITTSIGCKVMTFLRYSLSFMSVWLIVAATFSRFLAMRFELKSLQYNWRRRTMVSVLVIAVFSCATSLHLLWTVEARNDAESACYRSSASNSFLWVIWPWIDILLYFFIPFVSIVIFNSLILYRIRHRNYIPFSADRSDNSDADQQCECISLKDMTRKRDVIDFKRTRMNNRITILLVSISIVFLVTTLPFVGTVIFLKLWQHKHGLSQSEVETIKITYSIFELLMYLNHAIHFYLYCLCGKKFRLRLKYLLCRCSEKNNLHSFV